MKRKQRNSSLELLRLLACFGVILLHFGTSSLKADGSLDTPSLVIWSFSNDAVPVFFALTGCFWFTSGKSWHEAVLQFARRVFLPALLTVLFFSALGNWFYSPELSLSLRQLSVPPFQTILQGVLRWDVTLWTEDLGHLWYVFTYGGVLLVYPLLCGAVKHKPKETGIFLFICFLLKSFAIAAHFMPALSSWLPLNSNALPMPGSAVIAMLLGWKLYENRDKLSGSQFILIGAALLLASLTIRALLVGKICLFFHTNDNALTSWDTAFSMLSVTGWMMIFLNLHLPDRAGHIITTLASYSYGVYLLHFLLRRKMNSMGLLVRLKDLFETVTGIPAIDRLVYAVFIILFVYTLCSLPVFLFRSIPRSLSLLKDRSSQRR